MSFKTELTSYDAYNLYDKFITDTDIDELELGLAEPNIFEVLKITHNEIRHSNFLAWLLNPQGSHGLGDLFLKRFLRHLFSSDKVSNLDPLSVLEADLSKARIKREWKHIDLFIELEEMVILIENKVYAQESKGQLKRYKDRVEKEYPNHEKVYVFLTPEGIESEAQKEWYQEVSYQMIVGTLEQILSVFERNFNLSAKTYIEDYLTILKREIMSGDKLSKLAQRIYYNHKELMDFIIENRPDAVDEIREILMTEVRKKGFTIGSENKYYVRFTTKAIDELTYIGSKNHGWRKKESFLFELNISPRSLIFRTVLAPTDETYKRDKVAEILISLSGSHEPKGDKWLVHFDAKMKLVVEEFHMSSEEKLIKDFENFWIKKIEPVINKVEQAFIDNSELLLQLKEDAEHTQKP